MEGLAGVVPPADIVLITGLSKLFRKVNTVAQAFCDAILNICLEEANAIECGVAVLTELDLVLRQHKDSMAITTTGFIAINILICQDSGDSGGRKALALRLGLVPFVLDAMSRHPPPSSSFLRSCCLALKALANFPDGKAAVLAGDGVRLVRAARAAHPAHEDIQRYSKTVLTILGVALE